MHGRCPGRRGSFRPATRLGPPANWRSCSASPRGRSRRPAARKDWRTSRGPTKTSADGRPASRWPRCCSSAASVAIRYSVPGRRARSDRWPLDRESETAAIRRKAERAERTAGVHQGPSLARPIHPHQPPVGAPQLPGNVDERPIARDTEVGASVCCRARHAFEDQDRGPGDREPYRIEGRRPQRPRPLIDQVSPRVTGIGSARDEDGAFARSEREGLDARVVPGLRLVSPDREDDGVAVGQDLGKAMAALRAGWHRAW